MKTTLFAIACAISVSALAQTTVKGYVVDDTNRPVIGAQVMEVGSRNGTTTNIDGSFLIELMDSTAQIAFGFQGYEPDTLYLTGAQLNQVVLKEQQEASIASSLDFATDYRFWCLFIWILVCVWLVLRTFRGVASA